MGWPGWGQGGLSREMGTRPITNVMEKKEGRGSRRQSRAKK